MIDKCVLCGCSYLIKMETAKNPVTGNLGYVQCAEKECKHIHDWPYKRGNMTV